MFSLRCTVRNCRQPLNLAGRALTCSRGHLFDRAKTGVWNLTQPQDKKSRNPGDSDDAVLARHRWLERGLMQGLIQTLAPWIAALPPTANLLDLGCGEGTFGPALFPTSADRYCGIDLSRRALRIASKQWPEATWVLANADRELPADDNSVDAVVSLFGRRPVAEIARVLSPQGCCIVAVPGAADLIELRQEVQNEGRLISRWPSVVDEFSGANLHCESRTLWQETHALDADAVSDALAMTYRAVRRSQQQQLAQLADVPLINVTLAADLMLFRYAATNAPQQ